jgi:hypothetical protein
MMGPTWNHAPEEIDQHVLDLLVDGELTDEQERALLARLDDLPDGWRRCALALLESRCWQRAAGVMTHAWHNNDHNRQPAAARRLGSPWRAQPWMSALLIAATFVLAFGIGNLFPRRGDRSGGGPLVQPSTSTRPGGPDTALTQIHNAPADPRAGQVEAPADRYLGNVRFVNEAGGEIDVPVYDWNQQAAEELLYRSQPLSPELVRQLKRHHVRSSRSYLPVRLQDGREVVVPVQEVDIMPVGGTVY